MRVCGECGEENPERARFCLGCGQPLAAVCAQCGEENPERARFCLGCGQPLPTATAPPRKPAVPEPVPGPAAAAEERSRKVVTVIFSDVTGSTALAERLDPEAVRSVMSRYFNVMRTVLEGHGGTVEKFIGDAVMAVFGIPVVREDDALRAVRAVADIRREAAVLSREMEEQFGVSVRFRTGVNTGEVIAGDASAGQSFASGDTVNVAARLEQAAPPGEILLGDRTYRAVRHAVAAEPVEPLVLKGKAEPVPAWRLLEVDRAAGGPPRAGTARLVGRDEELAVLRAAFDRARAARRSSLVTVFGEAGLGKSRLVEAFVESVQDVATVVRGQCLSYGQGITFWAFQEVIRSLAGLTGDETPADAADALGRILAADPDGAVVAHRLGQILGVVEADAPAQEIFWAVRRLLEASARDRALVVVLDDLHWAEPTFLDLVEYLAGFIRDTAVMLLCAARPEMLEARIGWGGGDPEAVAVHLRPLNEGDCTELIDGILGADGLPDELRRRVIDVADGNPLFAAEMARMLADEREQRETASGRLAGDNLDKDLPATLEALLAARLDRLDAEERAVLQRSSVVGREFWWGAVADLSPPPARPAVGPRLQALVRKEIITPEASTLAGEDAFRFTHILLRDAAYRATSKAVRSELHRRFAAWMEQRLGERVTEYEEILGHHLEAAYRLSAELGPVGEDVRRCADQAAGHLAAAGRRAFARGDPAGAANLLARAAELFSSGDLRRIEADIDLGRARERNGDHAGAFAAVERALATARTRGDARLEMLAVLHQARLKMNLGGEGTIAAAGTAAEQALSVFEATGYEAGSSEALVVLGVSAYLRGQTGEAEERLERALVHDRAAGGHDDARILRLLAVFAPNGPTPVPAAIERCQAVLEHFASRPSARSEPLVALGQLHAMAGEFGTSRRLLDDAATLGAQFPGGFTPSRQTRGRIEFWAGNLPAAEEELRQDCAFHEAQGDHNFLSTSAALLAQVLYARGHDDDAAHWAKVAAGAADTDDVLTQVIWRGAQAKLLARSGQVDDAEHLARQGVDLAAGTDWLNVRGDAHADLALVLHATGRHDEARAAARDALAHYETKGNVVGAAAARRLITGP